MCSLRLLRATKKHPEHFEEIKKLTKRRKQLSEKLDTIDKNKKHLAAFESKTISAFTTAVTGRLAKAFPDRYDTRTAAGKIKLQKDIATIRIACDNKVPAVSTNDRSLFLGLRSWKNNNRILKKPTLSTRLI